MGDVVKMTVENSTLSERINVYAEAWLDTKSKRKAYEAAGYKSATHSNAAAFHAQHWDEIKKHVSTKMASHVPMAIEVLAEVATKGRSETARVKAALELLDRAGFDKTTKIQVNQEEAKDHDTLKAELQELLKQSKGDFQFID